MLNFIETQRFQPGFLSQQPGLIMGEMNYVVPPKFGRNVVEQGSEVSRQGTYESVPVNIHDGRQSEQVFDLDDQGFRLTTQHSRVSNYYDDAEVEQVYYPEMQRLLKAATGAQRAVIFDHTVRAAGASSDSASGDGTMHAPVKIVHNDYTQKSGPQRVLDLLGDEAEDLLKRRFAIVNVWRSIEGEVASAPLAVIDSNSLKRSDLVPTDLVYPDRIGEIYEIVANPDHRWFYFPKMTEDEVLLIKGYDSDLSKARFTPHSAFDHPDTPTDGLNRKSIEIRSLIFF